ncbi:hypothetical protein [Turicimonas muris]|uniref:hypothetical protein n=1 Tax=Turicimonas muris TaxID=1796652 RepID=UPI00146DA6E9|nr:hypothetical protein [Turicimonas muris]MBS4768625.1 hypothetical protein [Burkholderiales bacterium]QQQ97718.1 hypothetical protein I5Q81_05190 [Turicimonas muris]
MSSIRTNHNSEIQCIASERDCSVVLSFITPSLRTRWTIKPVGSNGWSLQSK